MLYGKAKRYRKGCGKPLSARQALSQGMQQAATQIRSSYQNSRKNHV
jgi:hypothetical protein